jgi:hypothetical protein
MSIFELCKVLATSVDININSRCETVEELSGEAQPR